jgi:hypothetical protein
MCFKDTLDNISADVRYREAGTKTAKGGVARAGNPPRNKLRNICIESV